MGTLDKFVQKYLIIGHTSHHTVISRGHVKQDVKHGGSPIEVFIVRERLRTHKTNAYIPFIFEGEIVNLANKEY